MLYNNLVVVEFQRILAASRSRTNDSRLQNDYARAGHRNWMPSINSDSGSWLSAGLSPKVFVISIRAFILTVPRRNTFEDSTIPKHTPLLSREDSG